jgi:Domain of unknown function (DUF4357)
MEFFLAQIQVILPVIGVDALRLRPAKAKMTELTVLATVSKGVESSSTELANRQTGEDGLELELESPKLKVKAQAIDQDGEITVLAGSLAVPPGNVGPNGARPIREQLIQDGRLKPNENGSAYVFTEDVTFNSPSAAAAVIYDRSANGRIDWKVKGTGQTLKQWQDAQLEKVNTGLNINPPMAKEEHQSG